MLSPRVLSTSACILLLALTGCGEREFEPVVAAEEDVEPLPAPLPVAGAVTAPGVTAPGAVTAGDATIPADGVEPVALAVIAPVPGQDPAGPPVESSTIVRVSEDGAVATDGSMAAIAFADGTLPPLEDNPEAGLAIAPAPAIAPVPAPVTAPDRTGVAAASGEREAVAAVRAYYDALRSGDVARAYSAWSDGGRASGRTPEQFAAGAEGLAIASVSVGEPGHVEGTAGSRHVEVPVTVTSRGRDGREVRQVGSFVMRSSQVEGAARGWHIASAELRELQP